MTRLEVIQSGYETPTSFDETQDQGKLHPFIVLQITSL